MMQHIRALVFLVSLGLAACASQETRPRFEPRSEDLAAASGRKTTPRYKYSELQIKDYDEMLSQVKVRVKAASKILKNSEVGSDEDQAAVEELRSALLLMLSRPNQDNMLAKLLPEVRKELVNLSAFEDSLAGLAVESIEGLNNDRLPTVYRSTSLLVLENVLSEFKPEIREKEDLRRIFEKIRDAKLEIPSEVKKDLKLRSMFSVESPSEKADRILKEVLNNKK